MGEGHKQWHEAVRTACLPRSPGGTAGLSERPQGCVHTGGGPDVGLACARASASCSGDAILMPPASPWQGQGGAWDLPVIGGGGRRKGR